MSDDKKRLAAECWRRGTEAMQKENWDYAIQMFSQCVRFDAANLLFRQTLRGCEFKKYGGNKSGAKMSGMRLMGPRGRIKKGQLQKAWTAVEEACEEGLAINPWDPQLHADLGEATKHLGYKEIAAYCYERAVENDPGSKLFLRTLAELYEERGDFKLAVVCWERICKIDPQDGEARQRSRQAATNQVIDKGGYEGAENTKGVLADHEVQKRLNIQKEGSADGPGQSEEADLQRAIRKEPDNKDNYLKLGDLFRRNGKLEDARQMFEKACELTGNNANVRELVEDCEIDMMRKNVELARERAGKSADDAVKARFKELQRELLLREMEVLRTRVDRYPADLRIKFQLAECFQKEGKFALAIPLFQQASQDTRLEVKALCGLGMCFLQEKKYPLAKRQFEKAVPKLSLHDAPDLFKEVHYWLGRLCESAKDRDSAESHYSEILAVDYEYKDTLKRLERLQSGEEAGAE